MQLSWPESDHVDRMFELVFGHMVSGRRQLCVWRMINPCMTLKR